jgi:hypothetical protein
MANPGAASSASLQDRLIQLAQTLQFAWFAGHVTLLLCTLRYSLSAAFFKFSSGWAQFSYRTAFIAATVTYGIVVYKSFRARQKTGKPVSPLSFATDENVQYLSKSERRHSHGDIARNRADQNFLPIVMSLVWLFYRQYVLALAPYAVYSIFHVLTYTRGILLPTITPAPPASAAGQKPAPSALSETIAKFVREYYDTSMSLVAGLELALWFRVLFSAIIFAKGSWIILVLYTVFLRARIGQSTFVQGMIKQIAARGDQYANRQDVPPAVRSGWQTAKNILKQAHDQTDVNRYVSGPQPPKKAQ